MTTRLVFHPDPADMLGTYDVVDEIVRYEPQRQVVYLDVDGREHRTATTYLHVATGTLPGDTITDHRGRPAKVGSIRPLDAAGTRWGLYAPDGALITRGPIPA